MEILLRSVEHFFGKLEDIVGLHPVAVRKFSLSSFSFLAGQMHLTRNLKPGCFISNHAAIYSALKRGMRGGVTMVCRTAAGDNVAGGLGRAEPNGHLRGREEEEESGSRRQPGSQKLYTHYYDAVALYPSSGEG